MGESFYDVLGVNERASQTEIKKAYRQMSLKYHPDKNQDKSAEGVFQKINEAYEILGDESKRREYDMVSKNPFMQGGVRGGMPPNMNMDDQFNNIFGFSPGAETALFLKSGGTFCTAVRSY